MRFDIVSDEEGVRNVAERTQSLTRKTNETEIDLTLALDGTGRSKIATGVGFLDHMLELFARHGRFDLECECSGDLAVDQHHTVEDVGIVLGQALLGALGDKKGIRRFSDACVPMQECLARVVIDISGRPHLNYTAELTAHQVGEFDAELVPEFLEALVTNARITLHVDLLRTGNTHHAIEAIFKGLARALRDATRIDADAAGQVPSTKGII